MGSTVGTYLGYLKRRNGKMTESKKPWLEPELIVLVRNKPEEVVLSSCKLSGGGDGNNNDNDGCFITPFSCALCSFSTQS